MVDELTGMGFPDWIANVPTMPGAYLMAINANLFIGDGYLTYQGQPSSGHMQCN